jgi:hypothetical protein
MRRFTFIILVALFLLIAIAAYFQIRAAQRPGQFPGPGTGTPNPPTASRPMGA